MVYLYTMYVLCTYAYIYIHKYTTLNRTYIYIYYICAWLAHFGFRWALRPKHAIWKLCAHFYGLSGISVEECVYNKNGISNITYIYSIICYGVRRNGKKRTTRTTVSSDWTGGVFPVFGRLRPINLAGIYCT